MRRIVCWLVVAALASPAARADDKPKDDKPKTEKKELSPKEQFQALQSEFNTQRQAKIQEINSAKGPDRNTLIEKYRAFLREYAEKAYKIAEDHPKDAIAGEALFFALQNGNGSPAYQKAVDKLADAIADMPGKELAAKLRFLFVRDKKLAEAVYNRAEKDTKDPAALDLLSWVMQNGFGTPFQQKATEKVSAAIADMPLADLAARLKTMGANNMAILNAVLKRAEKDKTEPQAVDLLAWVAGGPAYMPVCAEAAVRMAKEHPDHAMIERVCATLAQARDSEKAAEALKNVVEKSTKPAVKATATLSLAQALVERTNNLGDKPEECDKTAAEAEKYFTTFIEQYGKDNPAKLKSAEEELAFFRKLRVGKPAPEIKAPDLDEKEFKLSDYRGKVVLLDFWGNW